MAFSKGQSNITKEDVLDKISEEEILRMYAGIKNIPCVICSPFRKDNSPSLGIYKNSNGIRFFDFATKEHGSVFDLLSLLWKCPYNEVLSRVYNDYKGIKLPISKGHTKAYCTSNSELKVKVREWRQYDLDYWQSYGINLEFLKFANVYPISHKIFIKESKTVLFGADKYAYAFVEVLRGKALIKVYQPFNKQGFKWISKFDKRVISLWTKLPKYGDKIVICSSLKDALCLWANTGIPAIAPQGEGYSLSESVINQLKSRFGLIYICLDNDSAGLLNGQRLSQETGFINVVIPHFDGGKDISDYYKIFGKEQFINTFNNLIK